MAAATLTVIATSIAVIAAGLSAYSSVAQSQASEDAAKYNAALQRNQASAAFAESQAEAARQRDRTKRILAAQRAQFAKSGGSLSGSAIDALYDSSLQAEMDAQILEYRGNKSSSAGYNTSRMYAMSAENAASSRGLVAGGTLLGGLAQAGGVYTSGRR